MGYQRVLPRDLFNEAKLLKCLGRLTFLIESELAGGLRYQLNHDREDFSIDKDRSSGDLCCSNLWFHLGNKRLMFYTSLNSRENYPLICHPGGEAIEVFNNDGSLTQEFCRLVGAGSRCEWPDCENMAICCSGNAGGALVCPTHFDITNGQPAAELSPENRAIIEQLIAKHTEGTDASVP